MRESKEPTKSDLSKIDAMPESRIGYSDIPDLTDNFWENARLAQPPKKQSLTPSVRIVVVPTENQMGAIGEATNDTFKYRSKRGNHR